MSARSIWFRRELYALLNRLSKSTKLPFNRLVNLAVEQFLDKSSLVARELKLLARRDVLMKEERQLRSISATILRSGAYLDGYVHKTIQPVDHGCTRPGDVNHEYTPRSPFNYGRPKRFLGESDGKPLQYLSEKEKDVYLRICARREAVVKEILEIEAELLPKEKYQLKCLRDSKSSMTSEKREGGEK